MLSLIANIEDLAVEKDKGCRYKFTNRGYETKAIIAEYGPESVSVVQVVSRKYYPFGFFLKSVPGGYKISGLWSTYYCSLLDPGLSRTQKSNHSLVSLLLYPFSFSARSL